MARPKPAPRRLNAVGNRNIKKGGKVDGKKS